MALCLCLAHDRQNLEVLPEACQEVLRQRPLFPTGNVLPLILLSVVSSRSVCQALHRSQRDLQRPLFPRFPPLHHLGRHQGLSHVPLDPVRCCSVREDLAKEMWPARELQHWLAAADSVLSHPPPGTPSISRCVSSMYLDHICNTFLRQVVGTTPRTLNWNANRRSRKWLAGWQAGQSCGDSAEHSAQSLD